MKLIKGFLINVQFFTSIPIPIQLEMDREHLGKAVKTFPLLGLFQGCIYAGILYVFLHWTPFSSLTAAFAVWLAAILLTGGIHLDGWMDASDAFFSYRDQEKRLEIMKDPRTGAFGVISIIILLSSRFLFIYEITLHTQAISYIFIAMIPFLGKEIMGVLLLRVQAAKEEGLGSLFKQAAAPGTLWIYAGYAVAFLLLAGLFNREAVLGIVILLLGALFLLWVISKKIVKWFGGITGDVLGASVEGTEAVLWMIVWLLHYFVMA
ncbi:adenosylcobinamide-GDP ribazoletransferase [Ectobacillus panaciterrae]|uniref:adenosylcobinamide-GDP ribazoletransferase n=1 Tax=Ectobacillus panaciterrae TaxID=363872 RepID=UPI0003FB1AE0|nr:adenosylcobinamide-GDP ribazoletransferase [Ectobacillus panaciterrae]